MWVTRGGCRINRQCSRSVPRRQRGGASTRRLRGDLQADGYAGCGQVCRANGITRIVCRDYARCKFVEASKEAKVNAKGKNATPAKAEVGLSHINKLYAIERQIKELSEAERYRVRQELSLTRLEAFKTWLEANVTRVMKGSLTRLAMEYTLNQWDFLIGYCTRGDLHISNVLAENALAAEPGCSPIPPAERTPVPPVTRSSKQQKLMAWSLLPISTTC